MENKTVMKNKSTITIAILTLLVATFTLSAQLSQLSQLKRLISQNIIRRYYSKTIIIHLKKFSIALLYNLTITVA
jgi:hypothetical protein